MYLLYAFKNSFDIFCEFLINQVQINHTSIYNDNFGIGNEKF